MLLEFTSSNSDLTTPMGTYVCGASPTHGTLYAIDSKDSLDGEFANRFLYQVGAELLFIESSNESNVRS